MAIFRSFREDVSTQLPFIKQRNVVPSDVYLRYLYRSSRNQIPLARFTPKTGSVVANGRSGDEIYRRPVGKSFHEWRELAFSHTCKNHSLWFTCVIVQLARLSKFFLERKRGRKKDGRRGKYELGWEIKKKEKNEGEKVWCIEVMVL